MRMRKRPVEAPTMAYVVNSDDELIDCLIEQSGERTWRIVPVRHVSPWEVKHASVNRIPEGGTVEFIFEQVEEE